MGIYPRETWERQDADNWRHTVSTPGLTVVEEFTLAMRHENRTDCFCCSCDEFTRDPHCRNHGWAGRRPCEAHAMPGQADDEGVMPGPVRRRTAAALPIHRTEAGYPYCGTCEGGGCPDCTDPA